MFFFHCGTIGQTRVSIGPLLLLRTIEKNKKNFRKRTPPFSAVEDLEDALSISTSACGAQGDWRPVSPRAAATKKSHGFDLVEGERAFWHRPRL